jgi:hypothetical protein
MELTYKVRGVDGKEYGPVSLETLISWIREGRLPAQQEVKRSDMEHWVAASGFTELNPFYTNMPAGATPVTLNRQTETAQSAAVAAAQLRSGASWFYWIAGLSLINSVAALTGQSWRFFVGLGITQVFDGFALKMGSSGKFVAFILDLLVAGMFVLFGIFAHKAHLWAFLLGMVLFGLDGLIFVLARDWIGAGFHVFVLFFLFRGFNACRTLKASVATG